MTARRRDGRLPPWRDDETRWARVRIEVEARYGGNVGAFLVKHAADGKPAVFVYDPTSGQVNLRVVKLGAFREDQMTRREYLSIAGLAG